MSVQATATSFPKVTIPALFCGGAAIMGYLLNASPMLVTILSVGGAYFGYRQSETRMAASRDVPVVEYLTRIEEARNQALTTLNGNDRTAARDLQIEFLENAPLHTLAKFFKGDREARLAILRDRIVRKVALEFKKLVFENRTNIPIQVITLLFLMNSPFEKQYEWLGGDKETRETLLLRANIPYIAYIGAMSDYTRVASQNERIQNAWQLLRTKFSKLPLDLIE